MAIPDTVSLKLDINLDDRPLLTILDRYYRNKNTVATNPGWFIFLLVIRIIEVKFFSILNTLIFGTILHQLLNNKSHCYNVVYNFTVKKYNFSSCYVW